MKNNFNLPPKFTNFFIAHPWLKLIALALAILVWFYAKGEIYKVYH